jgi:hypothetical protein
VFAQFYTNVKVTQKRGFGWFNLGVYWKRKYRGKQDKEAWYLLTNLPDFKHCSQNICSTFWD